MFLRGLNGWFAPPPLGECWSRSQKIVLDPELNQGFPAGEAFRKVETTAFLGQW